MNLNKVDILAFGAHPDDIELGCAGMLIKHIKKGYSVGLCDLTKGELGSRGSGELRLVEAENARIRMGADWRINLHMKDGFFEHSYENLLAVAKIIRLVRPKVILCNAPVDRHPDHGRGSKLVLDACFYSGLKKIEIIDDSGQSLTPYRPKSVFHYIQDKELIPDFVVDITAEMDQKILCIQQFSSQFYLGEDSTENQTPISGKQFFDFVKSKNAVYGRDIQVDFAEGFITSRIIGVEDVTTLI